MFYELIRPFGPIILQSRLPHTIFDKINEYIENFEDSAQEFPNLLLRDIDNIYLEKEFSDKIGFTTFVENLGEVYLNKVSDPFNYSSLVLNTKHKDNDPDFVNFDKIYAEAWVNRYYSGDYSPLHRHGAIISGIVFLKITMDLKKEQNYIKNSMQNNSGKNSIQNIGKLNGTLEFVLNSHYAMSDSTWFPSQEMATVLLFPGWLSHHTYPFKNKSERRTLSFNLVPKGEDNGFS
jgi:hypothetical protein